jgi:hypothetical protein
VPPDLEYPSSRGFALFPEIVRPGPNGRIRLCLLLSAGVYRDVFEVLCQDVADTVTRASSEASALQSFIVRLRVWQGFMRSFGPEGLGPEAQAGLFSELRFLRDNVLGQMLALEAVGSWRGPKGSVHDFQMPGCSVEIKSTVVLPVPSINISSLSQLDETRVNKLILCHMTLDAEGGSGGATLPETVKDIRSILGSEDESAVLRFNDCLLEAGYLDIHEGLYSDRRYILRELHYFEVAGNFPRIRACEVRKGVASGYYCIEFSACRPFEIDALGAVALMFAGQNERTY